MLSLRVGGVLPLGFEYRRWDEKNMLALSVHLHYTNAIHIWRNFLQKLTFDGFHCSSELSQEPRGIQRSLEFRTSQGGEHLRVFV